MVTYSRIFLIVKNMNNHKELETFIAEGIVVLTKERRMHPQKKYIYYYVHDFQENNMLDYDLFCNVFDNMIVESKIYDKYKDSENKESYYNNTQIINSQDLFTPSSDMNNSLVTPSHKSLNNLTSHSTNVKDKNKVTEEKVKESMESFVNKLASLLNAYESLITEKHEIERLNI